MTIIKKTTQKLFIFGVGTLSLATLHAQEQRSRPNILFCIADDATFHFFGAAGCKWVDTPNYDNIAQQGLFFTNCYTPNAKSAPSRACILTGRNSWQLKEAGNHVGNFPMDIKVFTEVLAANGFEVACTGKGWEPGNPGMKDGKVRCLTGVPYQERKKQKRTKYIAKTDYAANFSDFLDKRDTTKPFFFWFGSREPHRKYEYGSGIAKANKRIEMIDTVPVFWPDSDIVRIDMLDYALEVEEFDKQLGEIIAELKKRDELDNTLIVVTADNGMPFPRCKANNYELANHEPLVMMWPKGIKQPGRTVHEYVSFIDFAPTFLDLAQVKEENIDMLSITGKSMKGILDNHLTCDEKKYRERVILGRERDDYGRPHNEGYPIRSIIRNGMMYIWNVKPDRWPAGNPETGYLDIDGSPTKSYILQQNRNGDSEYYRYSFIKRDAEELYDLQKDKFCMNNLAGSKKYAKLQKALKEELLAELKKQEDPRMFGKGDEFDNYPFENKKAWNFWERVVNGEIEEPWKQTGWVNKTDYEIHN